MAAKPRITIQYPSGDTDSLTVPRRLAAMLADALCDARPHSRISIVLDDLRYELTQRTNCNPRWVKPDGTATARTAVQYEHGIK